MAQPQPPASPKLVKTTIGSTGFLSGISAADGVAPKIFNDEHRYPSLRWLYIPRIGWTTAGGATAEWNYRRGDTGSIREIKVHPAVSKYVWYVEADAGRHPRVFMVEQNAIDTKKFTITEYLLSYVTNTYVGTVVALFDKESQVFSAWPAINMGTTHRPMPVTIGADVIAVIATALLHKA